MVYGFNYSKEEMKMSKNSINPNLMLVVDIHNHITLPFVVVNPKGDILYMTHINALGENYIIRKKCISEIANIINLYPSIDTILLEENKLFIDKIDRYPDPMVLRNIMLGFGIQISIEDNFYDSMTIIALPNYEWRSKILNRNTTYSIDLYKSHVLQKQNISEEQLEQISNNNYYKAVCLSESVLFDSLMNKKYQINKGDT